MSFSIQFTWWMQLMFNTQNKDIDNENLRTSLVWYLNELNLDQEKILLENIEVKDTSAWDIKYKDILLKIKINNDELVAKVSSSIKSFLLDNEYISNISDIEQTSIVWPSIWEFMKKSAKTAIIWWIVLMVLYILVVFSWMREFMSPVVLAWVTVFTLLFDITAASWWFWLLMYRTTAQIDSIFIIAVLTVMWYSINDTIVIFDRIRENFKLHEWQVKSWKLSYEEVFETSLWQTMKRSIWTSVSTLLVIVAMYIFGAWALKDFAFVLWIWVIWGTYSSIFLAAPFTYLLTKKNHK